MNQYGFFPRLLALGLYMTFSASLLAAASPRSLSQDQRQQLFLTLYNNGLGLVTDIRSANLPVGQSHLRVLDVARQIDGGSAILQSNHPGLRILDFTYPSGTLTRRTLLSERIGDEVVLIETGAEATETHRRTVRLLAFEPDLIVQHGENLEINPPGLITLQDRDGESTLHSALEFNLENQRRGDQALSLIYLTKGLSWQANHVVVLNDDSTGVSLQTWATLDNKSGTNFLDSRISLVAGDVNRLARAERPVQRALMMQESAAMMADSMQSRPDFEYHLYTMAHSVDLKDRQITQASMFKRDDIAVSRELRIESTPQIHGRERQGAAVNALVSLNIKNTENNNLGLPLPAGRVRVYKIDESAGLRLLGEDSINHTAAGQTVQLQIGRAFDVRAERRQLKFRKHSDRSAETSYAITVHNSKKTTEQVSIIEHFSGDWVIIEENMQHREDSGQLEYDVSVPGRGEIEVRYTVRTSW